MRAVMKRDDDGTIKGTKMSGLVGLRLDSDDEPLNGTQWGVLDKATSEDIQIHANAMATHLSDEFKFGVSAGISLEDESAISMNAVMKRDDDGTMKGTKIDGLVGARFDKDKEMLAGAEWGVLDGATTDDITAHANAMATTLSGEFKFGMSAGMHAENELMIHTQAVLKQSDDGTMKGTKMNGLMGLRFDTDKEMLTGAEWGVLDGASAEGIQMQANVIAKSLSDEFKFGMSGGGFTTRDAAPGDHLTIKSVVKDQDEEND